jgi:hypothetical protein
MNERARRWITGVGGVVLIAVVPVTSGRASAQSPPARVSGASYVLDIAESVLKVAPGIVNGLASSLLISEPLPPPLDQTQHAVSQAGSDLASEVSTEGPESVQQARAAIAPLAVLNPGVNAGLSALSSALDAAANPAIQPFDRTARELSEMVSSAQEPSPR